MKRASPRPCRTCGRMPADDGRCYKHYPERRAAAPFLPTYPPNELRCVACGVVLDVDNAAGERFCRNPACRKYVAPPAARPDVRVVEAGDGNAIAVKGAHRA